jgi:hypothetical protein
MKSLPKWGMVLTTAVSLAVYVRLAVWGWGGWSAFLAHPARAGAVAALVVIFGWALIFRSVIGVLVSLLLLPPLVARMNSEETLLEAEFGERYIDYRRRTWRLLPFLY